MPKSNSSRTITRQWEILRMIPRLPGRISTPEIGRRLAILEMEVTPRTVQRDLDELLKIFPIDFEARSKTKSWHWRKNASIDLTAISLTEALSLGLIEAILRDLVPPQFYSAMRDRFEVAREKLAQDSSSPPGKWPDIFRYLPAGLLFEPTVVDGKALEAIQSALVRKRCVSLTYRSFNSAKVSQRILHPLGLVLHGQRPYLVANEDGKPPKSFAIQRCANAKVIEEKQRQIPPGFSLDSYIAKGGILASPEPPVKLVATLEKELADRIDETPLSPDQKITIRHGKHTLTATVADSWQLHFWIMSQGPFITIERPARLQKLIIQKLHDTLSNYHPNEERH